MRKLILSEIQRSIKVKNDTISDEKIISQIEGLVNNCLQSIRQGGKIIFCGNGGSFGDAQHLASTHQFYYIFYFFLVNNFNFICKQTIF